MPRMSNKFAKIEPRSEACTIRISSCLILAQHGAFEVQTYLDQSNAVQVNRRRE